MKKLIVLLISITAFSFALSARPEIWSAVGLTSGRNYLSSEAKEEIASGYQYQYKEGEKYYLNALGPELEVAFYPYDKVRLGIIGSASANFIINCTGRTGDFYRRRHGDMFWNINGGISYIQYMGSWGFFADCLYSWRNYRVAETNPKNTKDPVDFTVFSEHGVLADLGLVVKSHNSYFKFGFAYNMPLSYKSNNGWSLDIFAKGGVVF